MNTMEILRFDDPTIACLCDEPSSKRRRPRLCAKRVRDGHYDMILSGLIGFDRPAASSALAGDAPIAGLEVSFGSGRAALLDAHSAEGRDGAVECAPTEVTGLQAVARRTQVAVREVCHRIYNHLQAVEVLVAFQARTHVDRAVRNDFHDVSQGRRSLALAQRRLREGDGSSSPSFGDHLHVMAATTAGACCRPEVGVGIEPSDDRTLPVDVATPLAPLATELLTNALTHALASNARDTIALGCHQTADDGALPRAVDDGVRGPNELFRERSRIGAGWPILQLALQIGERARFSSLDLETEVSVEGSGERLRMHG